MTGSVRRLSRLSTASFAAIGAIAIVTTQSIGPAMAVEPATSVEPASTVVDPAVAPDRRRRVRPRRRHAAVDSSTAVAADSPPTLHSSITSLPMDPATVRSRRGHRRGRGPRCGQGRPEGRDPDLRRHRRHPGCQVAPRRALPPRSDRSIGIRLLGPRVSRVRPGRPRPAHRQPPFGSRPVRVLPTPPPRLAPLAAGRRPRHLGPRRPRRDLHRWRTGDQRARQRRADPPGERRALGLHRVPPHPPQRAHGADQSTERRAITRRPLTTRCGRRRRRSPFAPAVGPRTAGSPSFDEGTRLCRSVLGSRLVAGRRWYHVRLPNGHTGWVAGWHTKA